jgi:hypothetical protein
MTSARILCLVCTTLLATMLGGCAGQVGGSMFFLTPYNLDQLSCEELKKRIDSAAIRLKDYDDLRGKAMRGTGGGFVSAMVYGPDYERAQWDLRVYGDEAARRNCAIQAPRG